MKALRADLVDEHYYRDEEWFLTHGMRYDSYDRKGPKVFAGEYACHGKGKKWNHYEAAILEAAFMTGFERNADIVHMTTPAPLFAHVDGWQWRPDQIWFDQTQMFCTVSYYVQQMYATNTGTHVLPLTMNKRPVANLEGQNGLFASAAFDKNTGEVIVKVANTSRTESSGSGWCRRCQDADTQSRRHGRREQHQSSGVHHTQGGSLVMHSRQETDGSNRRTGPHVVPYLSCEVIIRK